MSSIPQQEPMKPAPKSPIPRSRSDFSYVGLTTKEKRWTTDFSLLLPPYSRDTSGYSRLMETPVTLQPRTTKSPSLDASNIRQIDDSKSPTGDNKPSKVIARSQTMEPCITNGISTNNQDMRLGKALSRSPTLEPYVPKCSSPHCSAESRRSITLHSGVDCPRMRYPLSDYSKPDLNRHPATIRKSPTMDSKTLRYSPLLNISRSPTLDPSVLNRSPRPLNRSPLSNRGGTASEVVRSQSLRSLRKGMDRSPLKIRNSESAQSDVTCPIHKPFPLVEADEYDADDIRRLRNFSVTPKGLVNWGDSFRSHSLTSVPALDYCGSSQWDVASTKSYPMTASNSQWDCSKPPQRYKVAIMGAYEVGKTSLIRQFQTSEYICAFDTSYDINKDYAITVILNKEESELEFIEYRLPEEESEEKEENVPYADAHVIVYAVTNRRSFVRALELLARVQKLFRRSAVLLVGNKSDLVRVRAVTTDDGAMAAKEKCSGFLETSAAINHQVDELLVSILSGIRAKSKMMDSPPCSLSRAKGLIKKFLKKACFHSKSSDNLQRL